jgi:hypothetical protein
MVIWGHLGKDKIRVSFVLLYGDEGYVDVAPQRDHIALDWRFLKILLLN